MEIIENIKYFYITYKKIIINYALFPYHSCFMLDIFFNIFLYIFEFRDIKG